MMRSTLTLICLAAIALVGPARIVAHPGHDQTVMGTVKSFKAPHLAVQGKDGKVTTFVVAETTKVLRGKVKASASDITVGERIVVTGSTHAGPGEGASPGGGGAGHPEGSLLAKEIRLAAR